MASKIQRLVIVTETYLPEVNGVANTLGFLTKELGKQGIEVLIVRPRQSKQDTEDDNTLLVKGFPIPFYNNLKFGLPCKNHLQKCFSDFGADAIYIATEGPLGFSALRAAKSLSICALSGFHTNFQLYFSYYKFGWLKPFVSCYLKYFHNACSATFTPTEEMKSHLYRMGIHNSKVMSRGIDTQLFNPIKRSDDLRQEWGLTEQDIAFIYVGRLAAEKNLDLAVNAFLEAKKLSQRCQFILVGDGPLANELKQKHPDFIFAGELRGEALAQHYASGDIFLFPSLTDTFGNVVTEAMASGLSVLAFNYAAAGSLIANGLNGHIVDFGDETGFIKQAENLCKQVTLIANSRLAARRKSEKLSWKAVCDTFIKDISHIMQEQTHGTAREVQLKKNEQSSHIIRKV